MKPQNFEEAVIWYYLTGTFVLYFIGAQFISGPAIAWFLCCYLLFKLWKQNDDTPLEDRIKIPPLIWVWAVCICAIGLALVVAHLEMNYDFTRTIKSFINFFLRTWALFVLFPLAGCLKIRPQLIYRAACILGLQCLIFTIISYALHFAGLESPKYTSTLLAAIGGNDPRYYSVSLFFIERLAGAETFRLLLFAPWAPALAFAGNVLFCLTSQESNRTWRWIGMIASAAMVWGSASRLGLLCLIILPVLKIILVRLSRPELQIAAGVTSVVVGIFGVQLLNLFVDFKTFFEQQRSSSSRVRETLARMSLLRWQDAPIWGHGIKDSQGPQVVQFMPLGSHHTWIGLLYVHGIVGFVAFAIPMLLTFIDLLIKAQRSQVAQTALALFLVILLFSMGENLETLAYLYWIALVFWGIAFKEQLSTVSQPQFMASKA